MGLELELSELAVIRPIRTAVSSTGSATPTRPSSEAGKDAADTGCVTPKTTAVSPSPLQGGVDVDTGCVTPTAVSPSPWQGGVDDADDTGCVTPRATSFAPLLGGDFEDISGCVTPAAAVAAGPVPRREAVDVDISYVTPMSAASVLRPSMECPPAPRKPARSPPAKRKRCDGRSALQRCFFPVPRDLTKVFVRRGPADSSPPQQAAKKVRVHPVG